MNKNYLVKGVVSKIVFEKYLKKQQQMKYLSLEFEGAKNILRNF
jgi:hypothetical protein